MTHSDLPPLQFSVPSGIGDISWLYCKLVNLERPLKLRVANSGPARALPYLSILPRVVDGESGTFSTAQVLQKGNVPHTSRDALLTMAEGQWMYLQANSHLEEGRRIEDFLPELPTQHHYSISVGDADRSAARHCLGPWTRYMTFYTSSSTNNRKWKGWDDAQWSELAHLLVRHFELDGIAIIGAPYDQDMANAIMSRCEPYIPMVNLTGKLSVGGSLEVVRSGMYTVAFPSGMAIMTSVIECPVLMFYPKHLEKMQGAWADPSYIDSGYYKGCQFTSPFNTFEWILGNLHIVKDT